MIHRIKELFMDSSRIPSDKPDFGEVLNRVMQFILCGLIELGIYVAIMLPLFSLNRGLFEPGMNGENAFSALPNIFFESLFALLYILPLYFLYFRRNVGFKTCLLRLTEDGWHPKKLLLDFFHYTGKYDLLIYIGYSILIPLLAPIIPHYFGFIAVQSTLFYVLPIPVVLGYLLSVLVFAIQYTLCILLASRYWHKHRLHSTADKPNSP